MRLRSIQMTCTWIHTEPVGGGQYVNKTDSAVALPIFHRDYCQCQNDDPSLPIGCGYEYAAFPFA